MGMMMSLMFLALLAPQKPSPIGMVLQAEGAVFVERASVRTPAKLADLLFPGDRIVTTTGQATFFFCPSNERANVKNGATVELNAGAMVTRAGAAPTRTPARCSLPKVELGAENLERVGALRARGDPPISIYVGGPITTGRPTFEWASLPGAVSYQLVVSDPAGTPIWQQRSSTASMVYPQNVPALKDGAYRWDLRAEVDGKLAGQQSAAFEVKSNAALAAPSGDDVASHLSRAFELEDAGYFAEAAAHFRAIQKSDPADTRIARRLVMLYRSAGLNAAAAELAEKNNIK